MQLSLVNLDSAKHAKHNTALALTSSMHSALQNAEVHLAGTPSCPELLHPEP